MKRSDDDGGVHLLAAIVGLKVLFHEKGRPDASPKSCLAEAMKWVFVFLAALGVSLWLAFRRW